MKNKLIVTIGISLICTFTFAQPTPPSGKKWVKVASLSDEFNTTFDTNKWSKVLWDYPNTPTKMVAQNSGVSNGNLWIKATLDNNSQRWFQSSRVQSKAQIKYPMYTESRIITAHLSAYNTFWLNNGDINNRDEIDVIENNSRPSCGCQPNFPWQMNSQYFQVINGDTKRAHGNFDNRNLSNTNPKKGVRWNEQYHTVGVWWKDAKNIQFYLDGEPAGKVVSARDFTRNLNLIWDLWTDDENFLGGVAVKSHLNDNSINTMKVDWVHTYKLENTSGGVGNDDFYVIKSVKSNKWISPINDTSSNGGKIVNHQNENGDARLWKFVNAGNDYVEIKNIKSGRCIAVPAGNTDNGIKLVQWDCKGYQDQHWKRVDRGNGQFAFQNRKTGKCIDLTGGNTSHNTEFQQWDCGTSNQNQRFWILSPGKLTSDDIGFDSSGSASLGSFTYPNPTRKELNIPKLPKGTHILQVIDMYGQVLLTHKVKSGGDDVVLNVDGLSPGMYTLLINNKPLKFVKE